MEEQEKKQESLAELKARRERYRNKAFVMMLEVAVIFGLPAALAFFGGRALDRRYGGGHKYLFILLAVAYISSWVIVFWRYRSLKREVERVDQAIKEAKKRQQSDNNFKGE